MSCLFSQWLHSDVPCDRMSWWFMSQTVCVPPVACFRMPGSLFYQDVSIIFLNQDPKQRTNIENLSLVKVSPVETQDC